MALGVALLATGCARSSSISGGETGSVANVGRVEAGAPADIKRVEAWRGDRAPCGPGDCSIDGACVPSGQADPSSPCRVCDPSFGLRVWAPARGCAITLAGGELGFADGPASGSRFNSPEDILVEAPGQVLVADSNNHRIRRIQDGTVTTVAGDGTPGHADGPAAAAMFLRPHGLARDGTGTVFVAESTGRRVRAISGGQVTTIAGDGIAGYLDGPAATARFEGPGDVAVHSSRVYVTDRTRVRVIEAGQVSTLAGSGALGYLDGPVASAKFSWAYGIEVTAAGRVYVADQKNHTIRVIFDGLVTTLCGNGQAGFVDGPASASRLDQPEGLALDETGTLFFSEFGASTIRRVASNTVITLAGGPPAGFADGPLKDVKLNIPTGVGVDSAGRIYVGDTGNHRVRVIRLP